MKAHMGKAAHFTFLCPLGNKDENCQKLKPEIMEQCILIYEDDRDLLELCRIILTGPGRTIKTFNRCENIVSDVERFHPDLILMDLWIPEIGGKRAIELVKEDKDNDHIAVILFSANAEIEQICDDLGADGYLRKPFDLMNFKKTVESHLCN